MMNVVLLDHEGMAAREVPTAGAASEEISLGHKPDALGELAASLLKGVEELEQSLTRRGAGPAAGLQEEVQRFEAEIIRDALKKTGGHQRRAARLLGVKVSTLNAKIKRYGIRPEDVVNVASLRLVGDDGRA